jgi:hypothetical protein
MNAYRRYKIKLQMNAYRTVMGTVTTDIDYVSIVHRCYEHSSDRQCCRHHCSSLLCSIVATRVSDISLHLSLLILWFADVKTIHRYYDA